MNYLPEDLEHVASESSQQDWSDIRFAEVYRKAFIEGGRYVGHYADLEIGRLESKLQSLELILYYVDVGDQQKAYEALTAYREQSKCKS